MAAVKALIPGTNNAYARNVQEGETVEQVMAEMAYEYPGWRLELIGTQSFGANPAPVCGPEQDFAPGY